MFCVLSVEERNTTLFEKMFGRFLADEYSVKTVPVFKGAPFYMLDITKGKREIDWENVVFAVGNCSKRLLLLDDITIPEKEGISIFKSTVLYNKMMMNTFLQILKNDNIFYSVSIMDTNGEYTEFAKKISPHISSMTICTFNKEKYKNVSDDIIDLIGMCPVLTNEFHDEDIKINLDNFTMTVSQKSGNINISSGCDFTVPDIYENLLPKGINRYDFYSALYELCGVFSLGECVFDTIMVNNEKKRVQDIHFS